MLPDAELPGHLRDCIDREVKSGERVLWTDQPVPRYLTRGSMGAFFFGIPWTAFTVFWICGAAGFRVPDFRHGGFALFPLFGLPFLLIGLAMLSAPLWEHRRAKRTAYVITDQRAILFSGGWSMTVRSYRPHNLQELYRKEHRDGTGDVILSRHEWHDARGRHREEEQGFFHVRNPKEVETLLNALAAQARPEAAV